MTARTLHINFIKSAPFCVAMQAGTISTLELTAPWSAVHAVSHVDFAIGGKISNHQNSRGGEIMKIDLTSREVPSPGQQLGVFVQVYQAVQTHKRDRKFNYLVLVGELEETKSSGRRFTATTRFNLDDLRGIKSLRENLKVWRGSNELPSLTDFDPEAEFVGKTFLAEPTVFDDGGKREIRFSGFKPYTGDSPLTVSADFAHFNAAS